MIVEAFAPTTALGLWGVGATLVALVLLGGALQHARSSILAWAAAVVGLAAAMAMTQPEPAGYRMLAICGALLYGMKAVVGAASTRSGESALPIMRWLAFATLWVGMRPKAFGSLGGPPKTGARAIALLGLRNIALGTALFAAARWAAGRNLDALAMPCGLAALSLWVHFGVLHLQAAFFRARGCDVNVLFRNPPISRSLSEFWGRRWNLAFSEMTSLSVHRPLKRRIGNGPSVTAAFLFSGLLHELAISAPVNAGWGLPMGYFALHAIAMNIERRIGLSGWAARVWTIAWVLAPLPLLFHSAFREKVIAPLLGL